MSGDGTVRNSEAGTPQGGILSPLLANTALSVLDVCAKWDSHGNAYRREVHRKRGGATYRIVRHADDFFDHGGRDQSACGRTLGRSRGSVWPLPSEGVASRAEKVSGY
ncbi:MAG: hypothetical protein WAW17_32865 [Rhodococcus sp. (in: high G+C Gram-positive bacteria)]|uniref:hypothetical protein n=1 Tax=Rhodococcus sp. TaxID=1831 RepID=UPI003BB1F038